MKLESDSEVLRVVGLDGLSAVNASSFRENVHAALQPTHRVLEVDLSATRFIDSSGLGALLALNKTLAARGGHVRLRQPTSLVRQVLEMTLLNRLFAIDPP